MLPRTARFLFAIMAITALAGCQHYSRVDPAKVAVRNVLTVEPSTAWNRASGALAPAGARESWTIEGHLLHQVQFITGVSDGEPLIKEASGATPLPSFRATMTPDEIAALFEATMAKTMKAGVFTVVSVKPKPFLGGDGVRIECAMTGQDNVDRQGVAVATVRDGKLYMIYYEGTKLYHYPKYLPEVERMIAGAQLTKV